VPNASPYEAGKEKSRIQHALERVKETGLPLAYVNQVGGQDELVFDGDSFVMHENGSLILEGNRFVEETYNILFEKNKSGLIFSTVGHTPIQFSEQEEMYQALMLGLRDYIHKNGFPGVLIGLSGGIDSALSAVIAVDALGPDMVHGVMMPSEFTSRDSMRDAEFLAWNLGIKIETISIKAPVEAFHHELTGHIPTGGITFENIQPRVRGTLLMAMSNAHGKMVLTTGNKSEMAVGYATLYGDMCGGFNVLKDVYKTQVYDLANWRNAHKPHGSFGPEGTVIPPHTITRAPTAELRPNQTDQESLPPYDVLDAILYNLIEEDLSVDDIVDKGFKRDMVLNVWRMLDRAEYKRRQAPPGIKITRRAFGRDRRYPITNSFSKMLK
jgi:NAD+ synthase